MTGDRFETGSRQNRLMQYPLLEKKLYAKCQELRSQGKTVKRWCFNSKTKELMKEVYPDHVDKFIRCQTVCLPDFAEETRFPYEGKLMLPKRVQSNFLKRLKSSLLKCHSGEKTRGLLIKRLSQYGSFHL